MKLNEINNIPQNARVIPEDDFFAFVQNMVDSSDFPEDEKDDFIGQFSNAISMVGSNNPNPETWMATKINKVFDTFNFPYKVDKIHFEQGYEPEYLVRKLN